MANATAKYYFRFRICWCHCLQKVKVYQQTKFRPDISIGGWDITISDFEIQTSAMLEFYFRFQIQFRLRFSFFWLCAPYKLLYYYYNLAHFTVIGVSFCIRLPNLVQVGTSAAEIWRHIHFSRWRPRPLNTISGFVFVDVTAFRMSKSISKPNFVEISQLTSEI